MASYIIIIINSPFLHYLKHPLFQGKNRDCTVFLNRPLPERIRGNPVYDAHHFPYQGAVSADQHMVHLFLQMFKLLLQTLPAALSQIIIGPSALRGYVGGGMGKITVKP